MSFVVTDELSVRITKITSKVGVTFLLFSELSELWPYYQKDVNQIILNCITL